MITYAPLEAILLALLVSPLVIVACKRKYRGARLVSAFALAAYLVWVSKYFFFPILLDRDIAFSNGPAVQCVPFLPFLEQIRSVGWMRFLYQAAGNILAFVPISFFLAQLSLPLRSFRCNLIASFSISFGVELIQLCIHLLTGIPNRVADVNDLILNTLGGMIGYLVYRLWRRLFVDGDGFR